MAQDFEAAKSPQVGNFTPKRAENADTKTRRIVSYLLLALLSAVVFAAFIALFIINDGAGKDDAQDAARLMQLMNIVFGPVVTLFSSVVGFYFGARTAKDGGGE